MGSTLLTKLILVRSARGNILINEKVEGRYFEFVGIDLPTSFYLLHGLKTFDGIIGDDTVKQLGAIVEKKFISS